MILIEDKAQQDKKHLLKHWYWEKNGIYYERYPLPVADYILANDKVLDVISRKQKRGMEVKKSDFFGTYNVAVDTKKDLQEICGNVCGTQHARFRDECILAQNNGIKLYVLIENEDGIKEIRDLFKWWNPRISKYNKIKEKHDEGRWLNHKIGKKPPTSGETLAKALLTMEKEYGVTFCFCHPKDAGAEVVRLLTE